MKARTRKPPKPKVIVAALPAGTVLLRCEIPARAVPWKAPTVGRHGAFKDKRLKRWQETVALYIAVEKRIRQPYEGPIEVYVDARFSRHPMGDACNILKAVEDAMEGIVYINDRQVVKNGCERSLTGIDQVTIEVRAIDLPNDR